MALDKNMDVKDLFKNLKSKGGKKDGRKSGGLNAFFEKNPKMKIILPAVVVLIAVAVAVIIIVTGVTTDTTVDDTAVAGQSVMVLPQAVRNETETLAEGADPFSEDAISNGKITVMGYNSDGVRTAVVQNQYGTSYLLEVGSRVGDSEWYVDSIDDTSVTFSMGEKTRTITMK